MSFSPQLSLPVHLPDDETLVSFYPGDNQQLLNALRNLALDKGERMLYLWGGEGSGRTHLLHASCTEMADVGSASAYLPLDLHEAMSPQMLEGLETMALVCLDNIDAIVGISAWEEAIFDFYNRRKELASTTRLIVTANAPAPQLSFSLADLQSRLNWGLTYKLHELDDEQKLSALQLRAELRGLKMPLEVARFLLKRLSRDMPTLLNKLDVLDQASITAQRKLTVPFVKEILDI
ncbi:DnaA inactivator Hda [Agarivorans sp. MS3-6]|uniref:DnaA inactivator Hda n=1 Tax=Agarivorans sp. TSD2052 TaxID=2937286 RepID=UPI00200FBBF9|nr:DnaA inactivator Hda [Agarivorans sp. TSD2052]UPW19818.1 DnaA inactivator Hda [Agarivorans sp. TSD2052]